MCLCGENDSLENKWGLHQIICYCIYVTIYLGVLERMRLLLVEDEKKVSSFIKKGLEEEGYAVDSATDGDTGMMMGLDGIHDLIILDINLPGLHGIDVLKKIREIDPKAYVIMITAFGDVESYLDSMELGAYEYINKPFETQELLQMIEKVVAA